MPTKNTKKGPNQRKKPLVSVREKFFFATTIAVALVLTSLSYGGLTLGQNETGGQFDSGQGGGDYADLAINEDLVPSAMRTGESPLGRPITPSYLEGKSGFVGARAVSNGEATTNNESAPLLFEYLAKMQNDLEILINQTGNPIGSNENHCNIECNEIFEYYRNNGISSDGWDHPAVYDIGRRDGLCGAAGDPLCWLQGYSFSDEPDFSSNQNTYAAAEKYRCSTNFDPDKSYSPGVNESNDVLNLDCMTEGERTRRLVTWYTLGNGIIPSAGNKWTIVYKSDAFGNPQEDYSFYSEDENTVSLVGVVNSGANLKVDYMGQMFTCEDIARWPTNDGYGIINCTGEIDLLGDFREYIANKAASWNSEKRTLQIGCKIDGGATDCFLVAVDMNQLSIDCWGDGTCNQHVRENPGSSSNYGGLSDSGAKSELYNAFQNNDFGSLVTYCGSSAFCKHQVNTGSVWYADQTGTSSALPTEPVVITPGNPPTPSPTSIGKQLKWYLYNPTFGAYGRLTTEENWGEAEAAGMQVPADTNRIYFGKIFSSPSELASVAPGNTAVPIYDCYAWYRRRTPSDKNWVLSTSPTCEDSTFDFLRIWGNMSTGELGPTGGDSYDNTPVWPRTTESTSAELIGYVSKEPFSGGVGLYRCIYGTGYSDTFGTYWELGMPSDKCMGGHNAPDPVYQSGNFSVALPFSANNNDWLAKTNLNSDIKSGNFDPIGYVLPND